MDKKYAYDIFTILKKMDLSDYQYFLNLSDEEIKQIPPFVVMKWYATAPKEEKIMQAARLLKTNRDINVNHWKNSFDKKLQLLTMVNNDGYMYHTYIGRKKTSSKKKDEKYEFLKKHTTKNGLDFDLWYASAEKDEIDMLLEWNGYGK